MESNKTKDNLTEGLPLFDEELERNIIGHLLTCSADQVQEVREMVEASYFYDDACRHFYRIILMLNDKGEDADMPKVAYEVMRREKFSPADLAKVSMHSFLSYVSLLEHLPVLVDYAKRRQIWEIGHELIKNGTTVGAEVDKVIDETKKGLDEVLMGKGRSEITTLEDALRGVHESVNKNLSGETVKKTNTGFKWIDDRGGLQETDLIIIAAASSVGKTSLADSMALNVIREQKKVLFISMEMTKEQIASRLLSQYTHIYSNKMLKQQLTSEELSQFNRGLNELWKFKDNMFFVDQSSCTIENVKNTIMQVKAKKDIDGVVVDYLQMIGGQGRTENKEQFMARCARDLKNIAKSLGIWVIALSQLHRDKERPIPSPDRIRDSGQILEAADMVLMIYRPEYLNQTEGTSHGYPHPYSEVSTQGTAMILCTKGRNVGVGNFVVGFDASTTHFYQLDVLPLKCNDRQDINTEQQRRIEDNTQSEIPF